MSNNDNSKFSLTRLKMTAAFYYPRLKTQIIAYPILSFVLGCMGLVCIYRDMTPLFGIVSFILSVMIFLGPIVFATRGGLELETLLPSTWVEKSVFIIGYCFIAIPALIFIPVVIAEAVGSLLYAISPEDTLGRLYDSGMLISLKYNIVTEFFYLAVCMTTMLCVKRRRIIMPIVMVVLSNILFFFVGVIEGIMAYRADYGAGIEAKNYDETVGRVIESLSPVLEFTLWVMCGIVLAGIILSCYKIKNRQL